MKLIGVVTTVIESSDHKRGAFDNVSARFDAHKESQSEPYVISFHCEPGEFKLGDRITLSNV